MKKLSGTHIRTIIAIVLIIAGIAGLVIWEGWGRQKILYMPVIVAAVDIKAGDKITSKNTLELAVPRELIVNGAITPENFEEKAQGKYAKQYIPEKAGLSIGQIYQDFHVGKNEAIYYIPSSWISSMSTSIRRGDVIEVWLDGGSKKVGEYRVAFAKGEDELEVTDPAEALYVTGLDRTIGIGVATHVEIIATLEEYKALYKTATGAEYGDSDETVDVVAVQKYLLVQKFNLT